jgi:hypothetical protein
VAALLDATGPGVKMAAVPAPGDDREPWPRPEWVDALNAVGRHVGDPAVLVPLDEESLLTAATGTAGLSDFGGDDWHEGFRLVLEGLRRDARLNALGRVLARADIVQFLVNRLQLAETRRRHPEISAEAIVAPVFVTGTGRSGTSILHELMTQDPANRAPLTWEMRYPCPPPERATAADDPRIAIADRDVTFWNLITPEYRTMHENAGHLPNECSQITQQAFFSNNWMGQYDMPDYTRWFTTTDPTPAYRFHREFLQLLQWHCAGERWVLKDPWHLGAMGALFGVYPDARVVVTHRDPLAVLPSLVNLMTCLRWQRSDSVDRAGLTQLVTIGTALLLDATMRRRDSGALPDDRIIDVRYHDLVNDPDATMRATYAALDLELTPAVADRMRTYLAEQRSRRQRAHEYSFDDLGLDRDETRARFAAYQERYDIPSEI